MKERGVRSSGYAVAHAPDAGDAGPRGVPGGSPGGPPGLAEQVRALAAGETTSRDLTERALARIAATQPTLNAFRRVRAEAALTEAEAADRELARGDRRPLLGVPIAVKDDVDVAGEPTAFGCPGDFPPKEADSEVVRRLRAAGAVIVGKTNSPELGQWPFTEGPAFGETRNAWNQEYTPGGSSGGSATAVAAGLVPAALGSDAAGSVRAPAAWSHLVAIKPQRGRISTCPEPEVFSGLTAFGPLARTVEDAALLLEAAAGNAAGDLHRPSPVDVRAAVGRDPGRLRVALSTGTAATGTPKKLDPAVRAAVAALAERLAALGHEVEEAEPSYGAMTFAFVPRASQGVREWALRAPDPSLLDPRTRETMRMGRLLGGPLLRAARAAEASSQHRVGRIFRRYDVVLTPTTATPPPRVGELARLSGWRTNLRSTAHSPYAMPWNVLGWPAVNVPAGFTDAGLPLGAQLLGPASSEPLLVSLAAQLEADRRWYEHWPASASASVASAVSGAGKDR